MLYFNNGNVSQIVSQKKPGAASGLKTRSLRLFKNIVGRGFLIPLLMKPPILPTPLFLLPCFVC